MKVKTNMDLIKYLDDKEIDLGDIKYQIRAKYKMGKKGWKDNHVKFYAFSQYKDESTKRVYLGEMKDRALDDKVSEESVNKMIEEYNERVKREYKVKSKRVSGKYS